MPAGVGSGSLGPDAGKEFDSVGGTGSNEDREEVSLTAVTVVDEGSEKETRGGGASIFGVAFDDYIGEEGVRHPVGATATTMTAAGGSSSGGGDGGAGCQAVEGEEAHASVEEDRRWEPFVYRLRRFEQPATCRC